MPDIIHQLVIPVGMISGEKGRRNSTCGTTAPLPWAAFNAEVLGLV